jgi:tetratricopeptide (TPR) repeat protein
MHTAQLKPTLEHGLRAMRHDDYQAAISLFSGFLEKINQQTIKPHYQDARLQALTHLGTLENRMGAGDAALTHFEQYVAEARNERERSFGLSQLGLHLIRLERSAEGMDLLHEALRRAEEINYSHGRAHAFWGMGVGLLHYGRLEEALTQINIAMALFEQMGASAETAQTYNLRGIIHAQQGAVDKAIQSFIAASKHAQNLGNYDAAIILGNLGEAYQSLYDLEKALETHHQALQLAVDTRIPPLSIDLQRNIGVTLCLMGDFSKGIAYLEKSLAEGRKYKQGFLVGQIIYSLALAELQRDNSNRAEQFARALLKQAEKRQQRARQAQALHALGLCAEKKGTRLEAEQNWQEALFLAHETGQHALLWQIHAALAKISANPGLAATHWRIAWEVIEQIIYPINDPNLRHTYLNAPPIQEIRAQNQIER